MIRLIGVVLVWVVFAGGPLLFVRQRKPLETPRELEQRTAQGVLSLRLTPAFAADPDPFALDVPAAPEPASLALWLNGRPVYRTEKPLGAGSSLLLDDVPGLVVGENEFYVEAYPLLEDAARPHALRMQVLRDGRTIADRTFWSEPGLPVAEAFQVTIPEATAAETEESHEH